MEKKNNTKENKTGKRLRLKKSRSIRFRLTALTGVIIAFLIIAIILVNNIWLEKYYLKKKQATVINVYKEVAEILNNYDGEIESGVSDTEEDDDKKSNSGFDEEVENKINDICEKNGVTLLVVDASGDTEYSYGPVRALAERVKYMIFTQDIGDEGYVIRLTNADDISELNRIKKEINQNSDSEFEDEEIIDENGENNGGGGAGNEKEPPKDDEHPMKKYSSSEHSVELYSMIGDGHYTIIRVATQSITESVEIANRFLLYAGIAAIFIGMIIVYVFATSFTKPILKLAKVSERMTKLDFSAKYDVKGTHDEVDILGHSMNVLSANLEETIKELKNANEELQKDIKLKTEIDEMRKEFISNVSHELKTPIALISGYAEGLADNINDTPESRQLYLEVIIDEANKMNKLVKKLLALTQLEFGKAQVYPTEFDLTSVVSGVLNTTSIMMEDKEISVEFSDDVSYNIIADEFQTEEVITNFVSNAINHCTNMIDEGKKIKVFFEDKQGKVRLNVYNTGNPIPEEELEKVWIKFYKVDKARTREYGGSGIGLSIVKAIANSMNTECGCKNIDNGVVFWCEFNKAGGGTK